MPNLFSKIASQNGTIRLFSGGMQIKSLVPLIDVVRCMKFMGENDKINKEIFNLVKETVTVKKLLKFVKNIIQKLPLKLLMMKPQIPDMLCQIKNCWVRVLNFFTVWKNQYL